MMTLHMNFSFVNQIEVKVEIEIEKDINFKVS